MLVTTTEEDLAQDENESPKKKDKDKKFHWNHGSKLQGKGTLSGEVVMPVSILPPFLVGLNC